MNIILIDKTLAKQRNELYEIHGGDIGKLDFNNDNILFGYQINDKAIGYIDLINSFNHIVGLYVHKKFRRSKHRIGENLLKYAIQKANENKVTILSLGVEKNNQEVVSFYEKYDFQKTKVCSNGMTMLALELYKLNT